MSVESAAAAAPDKAPPIVPEATYIAALAPKLCIAAEFFEREEAIWEDPAPQAPPAAPAAAPKIRA